MQIYFGAPLFSQADREFNEKIVKQIRGALAVDNPDVSIYFPQENGDINDKNSYASSKDIYLADVEQLNKSAFMIALLDGETIDSGLACEIGIATSRNIPVIGLYTDVRQKGFDNEEKVSALSEIGENQFMYKNLFVVGAIKSLGEIVDNVEDLVDIVLEASFFI